MLAQLMISTATTTALAPVLPDTFATAEALSANASPIHHSHSPAVPAPPFPAPVQRRGLATLASPPAFVRRHSTRLAAKEKGKYVDMTDKAVQLKALHNSLQACSTDLQKHVRRRGILSRTKLSVALHALRKLARVAGLGAVDVVLPQPL